MVSRPQTGSFIVSIVGAPATPRAPTGPEAGELAEKEAGNMAHDVELMVRTTCGSCARVEKQITPVVAAAGARLRVRNVDHDRELAMEYGDRVPVVVIDDEEFACWEVDNEELAAALADDA